MSWNSIDWKRTERRLKDIRRLTAERKSIIFAMWNDDFLRFDVVSMNISLAVKPAMVRASHDTHLRGNVRGIYGVGRKSASVIRSTLFAVPSCLCVVAFIGRVPFVESFSRDIRRRSILEDVRHATMNYFLIMPDVGCLCNMFGGMLKFNTSTDRCHCNGKRREKEWNLNINLFPIKLMHRHIENSPETPMKIYA